MNGRYGLLVDSESCVIPLGATSVSFTGSFNFQGGNGEYDGATHFVYATRVYANGTINNELLWSSPVVPGANGGDSRTVPFNGANGATVTIPITADVRRVILSIGHNSLEPNGAEDNQDREFVLHAVRQDASVFESLAIEGGYPTVRWRQENPRVFQHVQRSCGGLWSTIYDVVLWQSPATGQYVFTDVGAPTGTTCSYRILSLVAVGDVADSWSLNPNARAGDPLTQGNIGPKPTSISDPTPVYDIVPDQYFARRSNGDESWGIFIPGASLGASILGPTSVTTSATCTWTASVSGGTSGYSYAWRHRQYGQTQWSAPQGGSTFTYGPLGGYSREIELLVTSGSQVAGDTIHVLPNTTYAPPECTEPAELSVGLFGEPLIAVGQTCQYESYAETASPATAYRWYVSRNGVYREVAEEWRSADGKRSRISVLARDTQGFAVYVELQDGARTASTGMAVATDSWLQAGTCQEF